MQYIKCHECINQNKFCQILIANYLASFNSLENNYNKSLRCSRLRDDDIQIKIDFECLGFKNKSIQETVKDCSTCKYGGYNDMFQQYFCNNNKDIECKEWNKWEARI